MGSYDEVRRRTGWGQPGAADRGRSRSEINVLIELSKDVDPKVRAVALNNLCPCHVRANVPDAWDRIVEMVFDPSPLVRRVAVHLLADGSPREREVQVVDALTSLRNDPDRKVRRQANHVLQSYRRSGRVNVL